MAYPSKRDQLLAAAIEIFSEVGIEKAKISDVVKKAGVAQGTFYLYFSSKQALVPAMAEQLLEELLGSMKKHVSFEDPFERKIEQMAETTFSVTERYQNVLALCYSGLAVGGGLLEWEDIYEPYYQWVDGLLDQAKELGEVRESVNTRVASKLLIGFMEEAAELLYLFGDNTLEEEAYKQETIEFIQRALRK